MKETLSPEMIHSILELIPSHWLINEEISDAEKMREEYAAYLLKRIEQSHVFLNEAENARKIFI